MLHVRDVYDVLLIDPQVDVIPVLLREIYDVEVVDPVSDLHACIGFAAARGVGFVWMSRRRIGGELRGILAQRLVRIGHQRSATRAAGNRERKAKTKKQRFRSESRVHACVIGREGGGT